MISEQEFLDFVCVGAPRSGTTWLAQALNEHPQIYVPPIKELNFFNDISVNHLEFKYLRGIDYYRKQFDNAPPDALLGELTPTYYADPGVAERIVKHFPNVRILIMLRNPADVIFSTYLKRREYGKIDSTFEVALKNSPDLVILGNYHRLLLPYFQIFPREHIYVGIYETFFSDLPEECSSIYRFLGVDHSFQPSILYRKINPRREIRWQFIVKLRHLFRILINKKALLPIKKLLTQNDFLDSLSEKIIDMNLKEGTLPQLTPEIREMLMESYRPEIERLEALLCKDLGIWAIDT